MNDAQRELGPDLSRRALLGGVGVLASTALVTSQAAAQSARRSASRPILVQLFLRGAMDGLTTVVPYGDGDYYVARPTLAVPPPGPLNGTRDLDGFFGLAPAAARLLTPYQNGHLALVHACGSLDPTRSHFDAFARMEFGDPNLPVGLVDDGWIARYLSAVAPLGGPLRAIGVGDLLPLSLAGAEDALPISNPASFLFPGRPESATRRVTRIAETHARRRGLVGAAALGTLDSIALLAGVGFAGYVPANGAQYPATQLGARLRSAAALVKAGVGVEVITIDFEGWDLHAALGPLDGAMAALLDELTRALEAFYLDLLAHLDEYVLVCLSEFGRRVEENASAGTDHGHGNALFVLGGGVNGGQVISNWPGLAPAALDNGDLAITTDYRDVLGEILARRLGVGPAGLATIFPQHTFTSVGVAV
ncbi:MAG: DUF1501 domain-containing protein [Planctomycetes bacterium]|nr:DUF1501 domain-containing protein [Planctomycetota bacterium]